MNHSSCGATSSSGRVRFAGPCRRSCRCRRGHSVIELGSVAVCLSVMAILCTDIGLLLMGAGLNDRACRDAARAAAQGSSYNDALKAARAALSAHKADGYFVTDPQLSNGEFVYEDFSGSPPPDTSPFVSVTTSTDVRIPVPIVFFGAKFGEGGKMSFTRTYNFPIVKTQLYL